MGDDLTGRLRLLADDEWTLNAADRATMTEAVAEITRLRAALASERGDCAAICDGLGAEADGAGAYAWECAAAIRARRP